MNNKILSFSCIALLSSLSTLATAASLGIPYVGVQAGFGGMDTPTINATGTTTEKYNGVALGVDGGYLFSVSHHFKVGPELGFKGYADNTYKSPTTPYFPGVTRVTYSGNYFDVLVNAQYNLNAKWNLIGKVGGAIVQQLETDTGTTYGKKESNAILPEIVLGVGYNITPQMNINASYNGVIGTKIPKESVGGITNTSVASVNTYMLGFTYSFV